MFPLPAVRNEPHWLNWLVHGTISEYMLMHIRSRNRTQHVIISESALYEYVCVSPCAWF